MFDKQSDVKREQNYILVTITRWILWTTVALNYICYIKINMSIVYQVAATGVVSYLCLSMGIMYTWPSSTLVLFSSANTTLNRPMTETEIALLGSLSSISALASTPFSSYILDTIGRKYCCVIFSLLQVISWLLVSFFYTVEVVLTSVVLSGFCCCATLAVPIYVNEICQDSIRGSMCSGAMVFYGLGMLVSYLMGGYMSYDAMNYACLAITILGVVLLLFLKDSPTYLLSKGREKEAAQAIAFYRGTKVTSKIVEKELQALRMTLNTALDDEVSTPEEEKLNADLKERPKESMWSFLKKSRSTRRALFVLIVLYTTSIFQGLMVVQVYAEPLFAQAIPTMSPTICSVIFAVVMVIAGFFAAYLVETAGRRPLMLYATFGSGICCILLGTQIHLHWGPHWLTACIIYLYGVVYSCGAGTVPFVMGAEIFLPEIRSFASMISVEWSLLCGFVVLFLFNPLVTAIGLGPIFYIFAVVCFVSTIFCYFCLPETKGLSVDAIQLLFAKPRRRNLTPQYI